MNNQLLIALRVSFFTLLLTGLVYPFLMTEFAEVLFKSEAGGSLVYNEKNQIVGSTLIGQNFTKPGYFFSRPSQAGKGYDGMASQGSNLGPTSMTLLKRVQDDVNRLWKKGGQPIPIDLVTTSASGLDPHFSPETAYWQAPRIALERSVSLQRVIRLIDDQVEFPQFYFMGQPRVNVLRLNLALDEFFGKPGTP